MVGQEKEVRKEIRHYKRRHANARDKEMVVERVESGSDTHEFLQRMELRRRKQECMLALDMRGKVPYECKRYNYRDRQLWLDDISYEIFERGLQENNGVFTVGTFEEIVDGAHTNKAIQQAQADRARNQGDAPGFDPGEFYDAIEDRDSGEPSKFQPEADQPEVIPLGYYRNRREARLQHSTEVLVRSEKQLLPLKTLDLSPHGLKVYGKHDLALAVGQEVQVTFSQLNEDEGAELIDVRYQVVKTEEAEYQFRVCLSRMEDGDPRAEEFLTQFVERELNDPKRRRKVDYEDERLTAYSLLAEQFYALSTPVIPFFVGREGEDNLALASVCINENNATLLDLFRSGSSYDLTPFADPSRLKAIYDLAQEDGQKDPLIAVYRPSPQDPVQVVGDFEFPSEREWWAYVSVRGGGAEFRVFKILARSTNRPDCRKIYQKLERLVARSPDLAEEVVCEVDSYVLAGALVDITHQFRDWKFFEAVFDRDLVQTALPLAEQVGQRRGPQPRQVKLGYIEQRREDRYKVSLGVEVSAEGEAVAGETRDISVRGFCVELPHAPAKLQRGDRVAVTLPGLLKRARQRNLLKDIPCEVVAIHSVDKTVLCLKRMSDPQSRDVAEFFRDLIERNQGRIAPDLSDAITAAHSRIYGSLASESAGTVPIFVLKDPKTGSRAVKVALPPSPGSFTEFFEVAPRQFDFSAIAEPRRLSRLTGQLRRDPLAELMIYVYKRRIPGTGRFEIYSATEADFEDRAEKQQFISEALEHDYCFLKVCVAPVREPDSTELNRAMEGLQANSPHRASKLQAEFEQICAVGDVLDVTRQVMEAGDLAGLS